MVKRPGSRPPPPTAHRPGLLAQAAQGSGRLRAALQRRIPAAQTARGRAWRFRQPAPESPIPAPPSTANPNPSPDPSPNPNPNPKQDYPFRVWSLLEMAALGVATPLDKDYAGACA